MFSCFYREKVLCYVYFICYIEINRLSRFELFKMYLMCLVLLYFFKIISNKVRRSEFVFYKVGGRVRKRGEESSGRWLRFY